MHARWLSNAVAIFVLGIPMLIPTSARAQLGKSPWSVELGTDVGTFDELTFAVRHHSSASSAFRLAVSTLLFHSDGNGDFTQTGNPALDAAQFNDQHQLALAIHWMKFARIRDGLSATFAAGPTVRNIRFAFRTSNGVGTPNFNEGENRQSETTFGLEFLLGAEWFFTPRLSLGGSTGFRGEIGSGNQTSVNRSGTGPTYSVSEFNVDTDIARITTESARIQLVAYF